MEDRPSQWTGENGSEISRWGFSFVSTQFCLFRPNQRGKLFIILRCSVITATVTSAHPELIAETEQFGRRGNSSHPLGPPWNLRRENFQPRSVNRTDLDEPGQSSDKQKNEPHLLVKSRHLTVYYNYKNCYLRGWQTFFWYYSGSDGGLGRHLTVSSVEEFRIHNFQK